MQKIEVDLRPIDQQAEKLYKWQDKTFALVMKTKVKNWKSYLILAFITGVICALAWSISLD